MSWQLTATSVRKKRWRRPYVTVLLVEYEATDHERSAYETAKAMEAADQTLTDLPTVRDCPGIQLLVQESWISHQ